MDATAPGKTSAQKAWDFLNSPFGLWLLTTIAVGFLSWSYSQWQAAEAREKETQQRRIRKRLLTPRMP